MAVKQLAEPEEEKMPSVLWIMDKSLSVGEGSSKHGLTSAKTALEGFQ